LVPQEAQAPLFQIFPASQMQDVADVEVVQATQALVVESKYCPEVQAVQAVMTEVASLVVA
jgi:hypothetical protein